MSGKLRAASVGAWSFFILVSSPADSWPTKPDPDRTPGKTVSLTLTEICSTKWGADQRAVTAAMKQHVMDAYGFNASECPKSRLNRKLVRRVEIDHLVPRSLAGADDVENLWPECYELTKTNKSDQEDGAHKKDRLEQELHRRLCASPSAELLNEYQAGFKTDWQKLYRDTYGGE